jgi:hypothetical protein
MNQDRTSSMHTSIFPSGTNSCERSILCYAKPRRFHGKFLATAQGISHHNLLSRGACFRMRRHSATPSLSESCSLHWSRHRIRRFHLALTPGRLREGLAKKSSQLKNTIKLPMMKPLVGLMLHKIVSANQLISGFLNMRCQFGTRLPLPDSGANPRHRQNHLGKQRFIRLQRKNKTSTKRPQAAGKKFLHLM